MPVNHHHPTKYSYRHVEPQHNLRRRMNLLERVSSLNSVPIPIASPREGRSRERKGRQDDASPSTSTDYETRSESTNDASQPVKIDDQPTGSRPPTSMLPTPSPSPSRQRPAGARDTPARHGTSTRTRLKKSWYEFDLAVLAAIVSPIGNWLTGGDHIKNLLLIILLIFYLHQIIEVPWALYLDARPRRHPHNLPSPQSPSHLSPTEACYFQAASSELHRLEVFFLCLSALSPLFGCLLLQTATASVLGPDSISWFSSGLFVLATGMRPWSHIVERLTERTKLLHDVIHYPPTPEEEMGTMSREEKEEIFAHMEEALRRVESLEKSVVKMRLKVGRELDDVCDRLDDGMATMTKNTRKQDKKLDRQEGRVLSIEVGLCELQGKDAPGRERMDAAGSRALSLVDRSESLKYSMLAQMLPQWLYSPSASSRHRELYKLANRGGQPRPHGPHSRPPLRSQSLGTLLITPSSRTYHPGDMESDHDQGQKEERHRDQQEKERITKDELDTMASTVDDNEGRGIIATMVAKLTAGVSGMVYGVAHLATWPLRAIWRMVWKAY